MVSDVLNDVYDGFSAIGFQLTLISAVVTSFISSFIIYKGIQLRRMNPPSTRPGGGLVNPPPIPVVPGQDINSTLEHLSPVSLGDGLIVAGVVWAAIAWLWSYLAYKFKPISAIAAGLSLVTVVSSLIHMKSTC